MRLRMGAWLGALAVVGGWWLASVSGPPSAREHSPSVTEGADLASQDASAFTDRLKRGLRNAPSQPSPRRNPFLFGAREPAPIAAPAPEIPPVAAAPPPPAFTLAGIATTDTSDGPVRTAVVSGATGILLLKAGDMMATGLRVVRVGEDHIVLADAEGTETMLRLK